MLDRKRSSGTDDGTPCRSTKEADLTAGGHDIVSVLHRLYENERERTEWQCAREDYGKWRKESATVLSRAMSNTY